MKANTYPEAIVGAFIRNEKGELLLVSSPKWKGVWTIPGGHVEFGERMVDSLRREVMEEVGLKIRITRLIDIQEAILPKEFSRKSHFIFFTFLCESGKGKVKPDRAEVNAYKWVRPTQAKKLKLNEHTAHPLKLLTMEGLYETSIPTALEKRLLTR